jgi:DME family drug/metabolite transporter
MPGDQERRVPAPARGVVLITVAAVLWGTIGMVSTFRPTGADPLSVAAARVVVGGGLLLTWAMLQGSAQTVVLAIVSGRQPGRSGSSARPADPGPVRWVVLGGIAVAVYQLSFFTALAQTGVAVGTVVSMSTPPVFAGLFVTVWLRQRLTPTFTAATALTITGCVIILLGGSAGRVDAAGLAMAGVAGLAFATYSGSAARLITGGLPPTGVMAWMFAAGGLLLLPVLTFSDTAWLWTPRGLLVVVYLAALTTAVAYALYGSGLRTVRVRTSATLSMADPGAAALLGLLVLGEPARPTTVVGLILLFLGLAVVGYRPTVHRSDRPPTRGLLPLHPDNVVTRPGYYSRQK